MNGREMSRQMTNAPTQARQPNRWSKGQVDARCPSCKKQFKQQQQQQQRRLKDDLTYESRENLDLFSVSILTEISQTEYIRQRQISKRKF